MIIVAAVVAAIMTITSLSVLRIVVAALRQQAKKVKNNLDNPSSEERPQHL